MVDGWMDGWIELWSETFIRIWDLGFEMGVVR